MISNNDGSKKPGKSTDRRKIVVVKRDEKEVEKPTGIKEGCIKIQSEEHNLSPLAKPKQKEPIKPIIVAEKEADSRIKTEAISPQSATNIAPLEGSVRSGEQTKKR